MIPSFALLLLVLISSMARAQEAVEVEVPATSTPPSSASDEIPLTAHADEVASTVSVPEVISGRYTPLAPIEGVRGKKANLLSGGLGIGAFFDDNALESSTNPVHDMQYSVLPAVAARHVGPRSSWTVDYRGAITMDRRFSSRNIMSHALSTEASYRISRHVRVDVQQNYSRSSNPFRQYGTAISEMSQAPAQVNAWAVIPTATRSLLEARGSLEWQFERHWTLGIATEGARVRFGRDAGSISLLSTDTGSVRTWLAHQLSPRHSLGLSVQERALRTIGVSSHTRTENVQLLYVLAVSPRISLSSYGGPQHLSTRSAADALLPASSDHWFPAAGASLVWRMTHFGARVSYDRTVADGGGIAPAVRLQSVEGAFFAEPSRTNRINLVFGGADNHSLYATSNSLTAFRTLQGELSFEHQFLPNVWGSVRYARVHLSRRGPAMPGEVMGNNRVETGLDYSFARPWGR